MENQLKTGSEVWLKLPYGDLFSQPHNKENCVFIAGGTGITPFLSLFTHESFYEYINPKIYLGFRSEDYYVYNNELERVCNSSPFLKLYFQGRDGIIDIKQILFDNGASSSYFISGPPLMIKTFKENLMAEGVSAENVLTDDWE
ncbi:MAG: FAD-dependent oxidoreductase [Bacteroidales bacterium]|nr:FAD-dependent oxidoreductase [Bacteroidales bacterium]